MARMYSRKRGRARSKKPLVTAQWVEYKPDEVERLVVKLAKDGMQAAEIGRLLRDQYGIPSVKSSTQKTISQVLLTNQVAPKIPDDLMNCLRQAVKLQEHMKIHRKDYTSKHGLELMESRIRRLVKYYVRMGRLPADWKYNADSAKLIVQTGG